MMTNGHWFGEAAGRVLAVAFVASAAMVAPAQADERVAFRSLDGALALTAYLHRPARAEPAPAIVMLHGCSGLGTSAGPFALYRDWRDFLADKGYVTLMVDSAASRGLGQTCTDADLAARMWKERPADAYAGLAFLQSQPFVIADKVALIGWSQGGGVVLETIATHGLGRPNPLPAQDFAAAIAFYPGLCSKTAQAAHLDAPRGTWTTSIPLLVLQGEADNWTPAKPCAAFLSDTQARQAPVTFQIYPGASHSFDAPDMPIHAVERYRRGDWAPIEGTNEEARADARDRAARFLAGRLGAKAP
ncbi:MAG: dienelactone hydrolase [Bradyrhizobium sp.]|nr:MAG: dienelactone hydrolase [Bradyrhizobium sp.]